MITIENRDITAEQKALAVKCLTDNGIEADEAETVLQSLGYILLDTELYPAETVVEDMLAEVKLKEEAEEERKKDGCRCENKIERKSKVTGERFLQCGVCGKKYDMDGNKIDFREIAREKKALRELNGCTIAENGDKFILVSVPIHIGDEWMRVAIRADDDEAVAGGYFDSYELTWKTLEEASAGAEGAKVEKADKKYNIFQGMRYSI